MMSYFLRTFSGAMRCQCSRGFGDVRKHGTIQFAPHFPPKICLLDQIDLLVADMAGTTVDEGGIVYRTLRQAMNEEGLCVSETAMHE